MLSKSPMDCRYMMAISRPVRKVLHDEFTAWYDVSELPDSWREWMESDLDEESSASAVRLRRKVDSTQLAELVKVLRDGSQERRGELVVLIENWTRFGWGDEDEGWYALQQLLNTVADKLE